MQTAGRIALVLVTAALVGIGELARARRTRWASDQWSKVTDKL